MTLPSNSGPESPFAAVPDQVAAFCAACGAVLSAGARFCHRCGTPRGEGAPTPRAVEAAGVNVAAVLPWGIAFVALLALVANFAGKNFGSAKGSSVDGPPVAAAGGAAGMAAPNIANLSPSERAARLYTRIMAYAEAGKPDSVGFFAPMALTSHEMLPAPTPVERFHFGRIGEITNNAAITKAQADTILAERPANLLGLLLAVRAARLARDDKAERAYSQLLLKVADKELATNNPDYQLHRADIDRAVAEARKLN